MMSSGWIRRMGGRTLAVSAVAAVGLMLTGTTAFAGAPVMNVEPTSVGYDEEFTISANLCFTQVVVGVEGIPGSQGAVTPDPQTGKWSTTRVALSEAGIPPGTLVVFAECVESFEYSDVDVTLVGSDTTSTTEGDASTSSTGSTAAVDATTAPRFTG